MAGNSDFGAVVPLESDPRIFTEFSRKLGLSPLLAFCDIYSITEPDLLAVLPRPLNAIILLFPVTDAYEQYRESEDKRQHADDSGIQNVLWFKQLLKNGCGLYGLLHAVCNLPEGLIVDRSKIWNFINDVRSLQGCTNYNNFARKTHLISNLFLTAYSEYSQQGQTPAPDAEEDVNLHFICFTKGRNGHIYELDGRRTGPVDMGRCDSNSDVLESKEVIDKINLYMSFAEGQDSLNFAMMGLGPELE